MINIHIVDPSVEITLPVSPDKVFDSQEDYVSGYDHIAHAIHAELDLHILVNDKKVASWLKVMAEKYGPEHIRVEELNARNLFQSQTGIKNIPKEATNQRLVDSGLLELKIPSEPGISFDDYLLEVFFGNYLTRPMGFRRVGDIIASYEPEQWQEAMKRPLVREAYRNRIRLLGQEYQDESRKGEKQILEWFDISPQVLIRKLFALKVLDGYPEDLGKRVFNNIYIDLKKLNLDLRKVPTTLDGNEKLLDEINLCIESLLSYQDENTLNEILGQVSGYLEVEFDAIQHLLSMGKSEATQDLIRRIQDKFSTLRSSPRISQILDDLDMLITKVPPSLPDPSWDAGSWIMWATKDYLPYRFWLENTGRLDDEIGEISNEYANWLYEHYGQLLYHSDHMVWKALLNLSDDMKNHPGPVLVVVVDNFNTKFYPDFRSHMQHQGFFELNMDFCFSLLPSCTEVSKKALLTGHYAPFQETGYQNQVEGTWSNRLGKTVKYLASISELRRVTANTHDVYFLNYLPIDITLHQNENQTGISHTQMVRNYLDLLTQDIRAFAMRVGAERNLMVVVVSDHGSTRIPRGTVNVIERKYYKERAEDEHHRYIEISDKELDQLTDNIKFECFTFKKGMYEQTKNFLVAKRLYRFLPTDDHAYIHGGLTPEETLVPLAIYQPVTITPKPLSVILLSPKKLYIGTKVDLCMEITNINNYPCENITIQFNDQNIEAETIILPEISQLNRLTLEVQARCPPNANPSTNNLIAQFSFTFLGQQWESEIKIPVEIVEPAKAKFDLDKL